jgi:hypothetical protein
LHEWRGFEIYETEGLINAVAGQFGAMSICAFDRDRLVFYSYFLWLIEKKHGRDPK